MAAPQILYGEREGRLWHVDEVARGLACSCSCPSCGRPLVAKQGDVLVHFFAHAAEDVACNPAPESLVHRYAKEFIARLPALRLPGFDLAVEVETSDGEMHEAQWRYRPFYTVQIERAMVEESCGEVIPDVMLVTGGLRVAVEVYFRHKVPAEKEELYLTKRYSAVEVNLSDLPLTATPVQIAQALAQVPRWRWLHNQEKAYLHDRLTDTVRRCFEVYVPRAPEREPVVKEVAIPSSKLAKASALMDRARGQAAALRGQPQAVQALKVRALESDLRLALNCVVMGVDPLELPKNLMQPVLGEAAFGMNRVVWQTGVFAKFCMGHAEFSPKEAEQWVKATFDSPALIEPERILQTANNFSVHAMAVDRFLRNLCAQGLLVEVKGRRPWDSTYVPIAPTRQAVRELLVGLPPALHPVPAVSR